MATDIKTSIIHMDDFFLHPNLRTPERLIQPGGNIHYERFAEEVLPNLGTAFEYRVFDCTTRSYATRKILPHPLLIVEGAYSHHPLFGNYMHLRIFSDISPSIQLKRIKKRNGQQAAAIFERKWIPMEEKYISTYDIRHNADIVL